VSLSLKLQAILDSRNVTAGPDDLVLRDDGDGPYIAVWNVAALGPRPGEEEIGAVTDEAALAVRGEMEAEAYVSQPQVQAFIAWGVTAQKLLAGNPTPPTEQEIAAGAASLKALVAARMTEES
jgi:hypothetical protein